ncbi:MAG: DNA polymerase III subunit gamma/tau [Clostridiaceae bacterium]|nr:DNA polymerase III subunit gamma/tau [Clostridiaceae bacterium]
MYQALYRKWRPLAFADVVGQQHITDTLRAQLQAGRLSHAYLFTGTRGTGKTTCAKILSRAVNCEDPRDGDPCGVCPACQGILDGSVLDVVELDAASNNGVDNIRDILNETRYTPAAVKRRVYIIDEVHMLSAGAFNALLKTLEEPPPHVLFILATTEIHKVPQTILSRCQRFDFRRIDPRDIAKRLTEIAAAEGIAVTDGAAQLIARLADGAMRDALSMLDRASGGGPVDEAAVTESLGVLGADDAVGLMESLKAGDAAAAVRLIGEYYRAGRDLTGVYDQLLGLIRDMLLVCSAKTDVSALLSPAYSAETVQQLCIGVAPATMIAWSHVIQESLTRQRTASNRRIEAELCAVRLCGLRGDDYDDLTGRVSAIEEKLKHGVPVRMQPASGLGSGGEDAPPPPGDEDAPPPPDDSDAPDWVSEELPAQAQQKPKPAAPVKEWPGWPQLLEALQDRVSIAVRMNLQLSGKAMLTDAGLTIFCDDEVTQNLAKSAQQAIDEAAAAVLGRAVKVKIRLADARAENNSALDEIVELAHKLDIEVTEF